MDYQPIEFVGFDQYVQTILDGLAIAKSNPLFEQEAIEAEETLHMIIDTIAVCKTISQTDRLVDAIRQLFKINQFMIQMRKSVKGGTKAAPDD